MSEPSWDLVALGEVMLRLDPGEGRIATARGFSAWEGGGEYNVARGLAACFGRPTAVVTALVDNPVGRLIEGLIRGGGVDVSQIRWVPDDGVGRAARNGLNFVERGFGPRAPTGCSDRGHTAVSQMTPADIDWDALAGRTRWLHCGGIFAGLSETTVAVAEAAMRAARRHGVTVSYDVNYRPSLWAGRGGPAGAAAVNHRLVEHVDILFGADAGSFAGAGPRAADAEALRDALAELVARHERLSLATALHRRVRSASAHDLTAVAVTREGGRVGTTMEGVAILDRVGGGDAFAAGVIDGLLGERDLDTALAHGLAHGVLAMTTPGDNSMATTDEVCRLAAGARSDVVR